MSKQNPKQRIILIAEDELLNYLLLKTMLEKNKYLHLWAINGEDALNYCKKNDEIALIIMDIKMPVMDGLEATRKIKALRPGIIIIAHTAFAMDFDNIEALEAGCDDYIAKPAKKDILLELIKKYI
jgi:CheY-like chemotaxis protein